MTNATKTLALIFAGTLTLALAASWSGSATSSAAFEEELLAVDTSAVQAVRIEEPPGTPVRLERTGDGWAVAPSDTSVTYPASPQSVDQLFSTLPSLQVGAVATRQPDKHPRYGVDSTGTTITLLGGNDEQLGQLIVGRTRMRRPQGGGQRQNPMQRRRRPGTPVTYVRSPDRPDVYSVEQSLRALTSRSVEDWRDKQIWALDRSQIQQIDFRYPADSSFTVRRASQSDTTAVPDRWVSAGDTLSRSSTSSLLRTLSTAEAAGFVNDQSPSNLGEASYTIDVQLSDGTQRALHIRRTPEGQHYVATADGYPYVVKLRKSNWDRSVLMSRSALLDNS
jgi:hypothetical protein